MNKFKNFAKTLPVEYIFEVTGKPINTECRIVPFQGKFDPAFPTDVVISSTRANTGLVNTEPLAWIERTWSTGFKLCATAQGNNAFLHTFKISAFAFQSARHAKTGQNAAVNALTGRADDARYPFVGSRSGDATLAVDWVPGQQTQCTMVAFKAPFEKGTTPYVVGSININNLKPTQADALTHWLEGVNYDGFKVCFNQVKHSMTMDDKKYVVHFSYLAVRHLKPPMMFKNMRTTHSYIEAGVVRSNGFRTDNYTTCKKVNFWPRLDNAPGVVASALMLGNHKETTTTSNIPVLTYVAEATKEAFTVCSTVVASQLPNHRRWVKNTHLSWEYLVFERPQHAIESTQTSL